MEKLDNNSDESSQVRKRKHTPRDASARSVFKFYRDGNLDFSQFLRLSQQNCYYCDSPPFNKINIFMQNYRQFSKFSQENGEFFYNGLDRINSALPHNLDNVVSCCKLCNKAKANMTILQFAALIKNIYEVWKIPFVAGIKNFPTTEYLLNLATQFKIEIPQKILPKQNGEPNKYGSLVIVSTCANPQSINPRKNTHAYCVCDCGGEWFGPINKLKSGHTRSCGNKECPYKAYTKYHPKFTVAKATFAQNYDDGNITAEQFYLLSQLNCWYCGKEANNSNEACGYYNDRASKFFKNEGIFHYNGLDRIDNNLPHNIDNIIPCCFNCNRSKLDLSIPKFIEWLEAIYPWAQSFLNSVGTAS